MSKISKKPRTYGNGMVGMVGQKQKEEEGEGGSHGHGRRDNGHGEGSRAPVFLSNNLENYWRSKMGGRNPHDVVQPQWAPSPIAKSDGGVKFSDLERSQTLDRFVKIVVDRTATLAERLAESWGNGRGGGGSLFSRLGGSKCLDRGGYAAERDLIRPHLTPLIWGSGCMVITFFSFRLGRWHAARTPTSGIRATRSVGATRSASSLQDTRRARPNRGSNPFDPGKEQADRAMSNLSTVPVDAALSMLLGMSTALFLTNSSALMDDAARTPLLEGRSVLAEELCVAFREEMEAVNRSPRACAPQSVAAPAHRCVVPYADLWKEEHLRDADGLRAVRDFVTNCRARERVVRQIAEAGGEAASEQEAMEAWIDPPGIRPTSITQEEM